MTKNRKEDNAGAGGTQVRSIVNLVDYQHGAVVSHTLVKKPTGTITLFAFDEGEGLSEHTTPYDAVVHVLQGESEITIGGRIHRVREGEVIIMPAHVPHALKAVRPFKMVLTMIKA